MSAALVVSTVTITEEIDIVRVRQAAREATISAEFSLVQQTKFVTAASELARNTVLYAGHGSAEVTVSRCLDDVVVRMRFTDSGPGIADVDQALTDGFSTGGGLGLGLGGARRLVDEFAIRSAPGQGTEVVIAMHRRARGIP